MPKIYSTDLMFPKPNRKRERRQKQDVRRDARRKFALAVFRLDKYRCVNPDCPESKRVHQSGLDPHHGLKKRPHNRELDNPKYGVSLCSGSGGCHEKAENDPTFLVGILRKLEGTPNFRHAELLAELERKSKCVPR